MSKYKRDKQNEIDEANAAEADKQEKEQNNYENLMNNANGQGQDIPEDDPDHEDVPEDDYDYPESEDLEESAKEAEEASKKAAIENDQSKGMPNEAVGNSEHTDALNGMPNTAVPTPPVTPLKAFGITKEQQATLDANIKAQEEQEAKEQKVIDLSKAKVTVPTVGDDGKVTNVTETIDEKDGAHIDYINDAAKRYEKAQNIVEISNNKLQELNQELEAAINKANAIEDTKQRQIALEGLGSFKAEKDAILNDIMIGTQTMQKLSKAKADPEHPNTLSADKTEAHEETAVRVAALDDMHQTIANATRANNYTAMQESVKSIARSRNAIIYAMKKGKCMGARDDFDKHVAKVRKSVNKRYHKALAKLEKQKSRYAAVELDATGTNSAAGIASYVSPRQKAKIAKEQAKLQELNKELIEIKPTAKEKKDIDYYVNQVAKYNGVLERYVDKITASMTETIEKNKIKSLRYQECHLLTGGEDKYGRKAEGLQELIDQAKKGKEHLEYVQSPDIVRSNRDIITID